MSFLFASSHRRGRPRPPVTPPADPPVSLPSTSYIALEQWEATRDYYHRSASILWGNVGGDWVDSAGTNQGAVPFASGGGSSGSVSLDVSALLANWTGITLRASSNFARMYSRDGAVPPKLTIDGVDIPAYAAITVSTTTSSNLDDGRLSLTAGAESSVLLDFDVPDGAASATLVIEQIAGTGQFQVYRTKAPVLNAWQNKTKVYGIGRGQTIATLKNHGSVLAAWEWTANWATEYTFARANIGGLREYKTINGEGWAGMYFRKAVVCGEKNTTSTPANIEFEFKPVPSTIDPFRVGGGGIDHVYMQYEIISRFDIPISDSMLQGGKFPGFSGRYGVLEPSGSPTRWEGVYGNGGAIGYGVFMPDGNLHLGGNRSEPIMAGWSARGLWVAKESPDGPLQDAVTVGSYVYHPSFTTSGTGDSRLWDNVVLMPNVQHTIEQEIQINTVTNADADGNGTGQPDGIHRVWVDGRLVYEQTSWIWTHNAYMNVQAAWLSFQHGGLDAQCSEQDFDWGPIVIATEYIGPRERGLAGSVLGQLATSMSSNEFRLLRMDDRDGTPANEWLSWTTKCVYNPLNYTISLVSTEVGAQPFYIWSYDIMTDTFSHVNIGFTNNGHGYDANALDPNTGRRFFHHYGWGHQHYLDYGLDPAQANWVNIGDTATGVNQLPFTATTVGTMEWVDFLNDGAGGVITMGSGGKLAQWNNPTDGWTEIVTGVSDWGGTRDYHSRFSAPLNKAFVCWREFNWKFGPDLTLIPCASTQSASGFFRPAITSGVMFADPVSGKLIAMNYTVSPREMCSYDDATDTWSPMTPPTGDSATHLMGNSLDHVTANIPELGVVVFLSNSSTGTTPRISLYKV